MQTPTLPLRPQVSGYQSQSQAWNSPTARKRGSSERVQILGLQRKNMKEIKWHRNRKLDWKTTRHGIKEKH